MGDLDTTHELPPLPTIPKSRNRSRSTSYGLRSSTAKAANQTFPSSANPNSTDTTFQPLAQTSSRLSQRSANRSFVDSVGFVSGFPDLNHTLTRVETRVSRVGKGFILANGISEGDGEEGETLEKEVEVAVQITPDGTEITFPDGGLEVSGWSTRRNLESDTHIYFLINRLISFSLVVYVQL